MWAMFVVENEKGMVSVGPERKVRLCTAETCATNVIIPGAEPPGPFGNQFLSAENNRHWLRI